MREWAARTARTLRLPLSQVAVGAALLALYGLVHALGLRQKTGVVCGMPVPALGSQVLGAALGLGYVLIYLGAVVAAPILLLGAALEGVLGRVTGWTAPVGNREPGPGDGVQSPGHTTQSDRVNCPPAESSDAADGANHEEDESHDR